MMLPVLSALLAFAVGLFRSRASLCLAHLALRHQLAVYKQTAHRPRPVELVVAALGQLAVPSLVRLARHSGVRPAMHGDRVAAAISRPLAAPEPTRHIWVGANNGTKRVTGRHWD